MTIDFLGLPCVALENEAVSLLVTTTVGPRILSLRLRGGPNLLAELPDATLECPGVGTYHLRGGHRFWHAPESARRTYLPDDAPPTIEPIDRGLAFTQPTEASTGLVKSMRIRIPDHHPVVQVDHVLTNRGRDKATCAPWAITQLPPDGFAILPHPIWACDPDGVQANRGLALWPYTDVNHPDIAWGNAFTFVFSRMAAGRLKLGFLNTERWLAYHRRGTLFVKHAPYPNGTYCDHGSSSQCYCDPRCLELETLGPLLRLSPGMTTTHSEVWQVFDGVDLEPTEASAKRMATGLRLHRDPNLWYPDEAAR